MLDFACLLQNLSVLKYVGSDKKAEWGRYWIEQGFNGEREGPRGVWRGRGVCVRVERGVWIIIDNHSLFKGLEKMLQKTAGKYCVGDEVRTT